MATPPDAQDLVVRYHDETKHRFDRFARSLGYLDWDTQPDPFRSYDGARVIDLVAPLQALSAPDSRGRPAPWLASTCDELWAGPRAGARVPPGPGAVSAFLRYSLGLSAWKQAGGSRWSLRVNPSSGNLHPTEGYVVLGPGVVDPDRAGTYHYAPDRHALHERAVFGADVWQRLAGSLPEGAFIAGLSSIHWREAWKYGERAFRYCQHDTGHAIASMRLAAALIGWRLVLLPEWPGEVTAAVLGLDHHASFQGAEREEPACLAAVVPGEPGPIAGPITAGGADAALLAELRSAAWSGRANRLSADHVAWDRIDEVAAPSRQPSPVAGDALAFPPLPALPPRTAPCVIDSAARLILSRRSAVAMDGHSPLGLDRFVDIMRHLLPGPWAPWDALWWSPQVDLVLFVHRVTGLEPGVYVLARRPGALPHLQASFREDFAFVRPPQIPEDVPLYLLVPADVRRLARQLSCGQDIAADGFFSLGMLASFDAALARFGPWFYRNLFWETGVIGQVLYLEAEAAGARGTGIGCFFDDGVHDLLGVRDHALQSLYHFTVGMPVDDPRLQTRPGYPWE